MKKRINHICNECEKGECYLSMNLKFKPMWCPYEKLYNAKWVREEIYTLSEHTRRGDGKII